MSKVRLLAMVTRHMWFIPCALAFSTHNADSHSKTDEQRVLAIVVCPLPLCDFAWESLVMGLKHILLSYGLNSNRAFIPAMRKIKLFTVWPITNIDVLCTFSRFAGLLWYNTISHNSKRYAQQCYSDELSIHWFALMFFGRIGRINHFTSAKKPDIGFCICCLWSAYRSLRER